MTQGNKSSTFQRVRYIYAESPNATYGATLVLNSMPTTMFQGEHYLVDIKMNNTGTKKWFGDPENPNHVILTGLGGTGGDAAAFNITEIPMIFENETASRGVSDDFFFYVKAPDTLGNYTPQYRMNASGVLFGPVVSATVQVIENPFNPVVQANGTKFNTTPFGNDDAGIKIDVVGQGVYIEKIRAASREDPRFLINPTLKSGVFDIELNDTFSYANITIPYDAANVTTPANLSLAYFNTAKGNYTFVATAVNTNTHTVKAKVN